MRNLQRICCLVLVFSLLLGVFPGLSSVEAEAVSGINSLSCSGFISNTTAQNYIDVMMRYYINNNSKLQTALNNGKSVIFMFEGGSDYYWSGNTYANSAYDVRDQAVVIVVQINSSGNAYIDFYSENCSSIPGDPSWCEYGVSYSGSTTVLDGIYPAYTTNHTGPYAALQLDMSASNGYGYYTPLSAPDGYKAGASGINVHTRATDIAAGSDLGWAWSEGCQVIGSGSTSSNVFNSFMKSVCGISWNPWVDYYASPKNLNAFSYTGTDVGYFVVDRQLGLTNPSGTSYGSGSLTALYTKTALNNITAYSTSARSNADFNLDYRDGCTFYRSHAIIKTKNSASVNSLPCAADTNGSVQLETAAKGDTYEVTGLYQNHAGNYFYEIITKGGKTGYIYSGSAAYQGVDTSDVTISGASAPNGHVAGKTFSVKGTITGKYNEISEVNVWVHSGFGSSGSKITGGTASVGGSSYSLAGSTIDSNTLFDELSVGKYTYIISASYQSYFVNDESVLMYAYGTKELVNSYFVVIPSAVSQSSCSHSYTTTTLQTATCTSAGDVVKSCAKCGLISQQTVQATGHSYGAWATVQPTCTTEGYQSRTCTACGNVEKTVWQATGHDYQLTVHDATCLDAATYEYICGKCGDHYFLDNVQLSSVWLEEIPEGMDESLFITATQYRYSDLVQKTSYDTSMDGYTLVSSVWEQSGTGSVSYVDSWSSGISTSNAVYTQYHKKSSKVTAGETATTKTVVNSDAISGYVYHHWCYSDSYYSTQASTGSYTTCHAFYSTTAPSSLSAYDSSDGSYKYPNSSTCSNSEWWWPSTVYTQKYTTYNKLFTYEGWSDWSAWSEEVVTDSTTRKVETRTVYQLIPGSLGDHQWVEGVCDVCGSACEHTYVDSVCTLCGFVEPNYDYYLFGWINGADYACNEDAQNLGAYLFTDGKLVVTFTEQSYVAVKTGDNRRWYMTDGYPGDGVTSAILYPTEITGERSDKLMVPKGREITFTLTKNPDGTLTLSYVAAICVHQWQDGQCIICDEQCNHFSWGNGICENCGLQCFHEKWEEGVCQFCGMHCNHQYVENVCTVCRLEKPVKDYYLFGFINGADYGCESDYQRIGDYLFVDGVLKVYFTEDSYVAVKSHDNEDWYMANEWLGWEATSGMLYHTNTGSYEKMFVPGGKIVTFRLTDNGDDSFLLSFVAEDCRHENHAPDGICPVCGDTSAHDYEEVVTQPGCTTSGLTVRSCKVCGHTQTQEIPPLGHQYDTIVVPPTCSLAGYSLHTCSVCGNSYTDSEVSAKGHKISILEKVDATCTEDGSIIYGCTVCGASFSETIDATGHSYDEIVTPPSCTAGGYTTFVCACGDSYVGNLTASAGHSFVNGVCSECGQVDSGTVMTDPQLTLDHPSLSFEGEILYNFYFTAGDLSDVVEIGLLTFDSKLTDGTIADAVNVYPGYTGTDGMYMVQTDGISAKNLGDAVYVKIYAKMINGSYVYSGVAGYNAVTYAKSILKNSSNNYMKRLVISMLNYGTEAQYFFQHRVDSPMNSFVTEEQQAQLLDYDASMMQGVVSVDSAKAGNLQYNGSSFAKRSPSVSFDGAFAINYYFTTANVPDGEVKLYYWTLEDYNKATKLSPKNATGSMSMTNVMGNQYWGQVGGIAAKELDETVFVLGVYAYQGITYTTGVLNYHVGKYCTTLAAKDTSEQQDLAKATAVYGYYAKEYFSNI